MEKLWESVAIQICCMVLMSSDVLCHVSVMMADVCVSVSVCVCVCVCVCECLFVCHIFSLLESPLLVHELSLLSFTP